MKPLRVKIAMYRHRALLECQVSRANAEVTWYKQNREIAPNGKYQVISEGFYRQLTIEEVGSSDEDIFICDAGDDKTSCRLFVEGETLTIRLHTISELGCPRVLTIWRQYTCNNKCDFQNG